MINSNNIKPLSKNLEEVLFLYCIKKDFKRMTERSYKVAGHVFSLETDLDIDECFQNYAPFTVPAGEAAQAVFTLNIARGILKDGRPQVDYTEDTRQDDEGQQIPEDLLPDVALGAEHEAALDGEVDAFADEVIGGVIAYLLDDRGNEVREDDESRGIHSDVAAVYLQSFLFLPGVFSSISIILHFRGSSR